ncbi:peroxiredoxin [Sulfurirhabdus autotrophica]|uniref:thioredoxin-dependent peroxiredoxin n=1 Tax=Sulfurirhabdus autotrophica TaxID=1706046 RepID=A0A4R3YDK0_9PROT|nr:peroxiredoxin [Sulfurirhabdus autotrophica]TCV90090.1 peroxiredoxin Q/BCP [Sulfurirhabdus autotrophica]
MTNQPESDLELPATSGKTFSLSAARGKPLVLYFYPKDNTPGCTTEAIQFRDAYNELTSLGFEVYGISRDSLKSHENFKAKFTLPYELLSDSEEKACSMFNVIKMKNLYGKQVRGIERSTFVIDADGKIAKEWRGVKVPGHVDDILAYIKSK